MKDDEPKHFITNRMFWTYVVICIAAPFIVYVFKNWGAP